MTKVVLEFVGRPALERFQERVTQCARGHDVLSGLTLHSALEAPGVKCRGDVLAVNHWVLRAIVDCIVLGDAVSKEAIPGLIEVVRAGHRHHGAFESFVFTNLREAKNPGLNVLRKELLGTTQDPEFHSARLIESLRFSKLHPQTLGDEHELVEDALARAAVDALCRKTPCTLAADRYAKLARAFRTDPTSVLPEKLPLAHTRGQISERMRTITQGIIPLWHLSREVEQLARQREEFNDLRVLAPLTKSFDFLNDFFTSAQPWAQISYFSRGELLGSLQELCSSANRKSFPQTKGVFEEAQMLLECADMPTISSPSDLALKILVKTGFSPNGDDLYLLPNGEEAPPSTQPCEPLLPAVNDMLEGLRYQFSRR